MGSAVGIDLLGAIRRLDSAETDRTACWRLPSSAPGLELARGSQRDDRRCGTEAAC